MLADESQPWLLKCAIHPVEYARSDAVVAYLTPATVYRRSGQIVELAVPSSSRDRIAGPPLTLPVAPGLTAAFDPGGDESFGSHRCRLIAQAAAASLHGILAQFTKDGVDPARPWARKDDPVLPWEH